MSSGAVGPAVTPTGAHETEDDGVLMKRVCEWVREVKPQAPSRQRSSRARDCACCVRPGSRLGDVSLVEVDETCSYLGMRRMATAGGDAIAAAPVRYGGVVIGAMCARGPSTHVDGLGEAVALRPRVVAVALRYATRRLGDEPSSAVARRRHSRRGLRADRRVARRHCARGRRVVSRSSSKARAARARNHRGPRAPSAERAP